ncbi:MAG: glycosyltransferase family 1 protein [Cyanobacteria bacterium P01_H01_bin.119]
MDNYELLVNLACLMKQPTGISTYAYNVVPQLGQLNPLLVSSQALATLPRWAIPEGFSPEFGVKGHLKRLIWTQFRLPHFYRQAKVNLMLSPLPEAPLWQGCRFVVCVFDLIPLRFPKRSSFATQYFRTWVPKVLSQAAHIICCSRATAQDLSQFYGIDRAKISVVYLSHDSHHFQAKVADGAVGDLAFSNDLKVPYFLYVGRHTAHKNTERIIDAFTIFARQNQEIELWIGGSRDRRYTPFLQQKVEAFNLNHRVKFLDYIDYAALPKFYSNARAFLFPSLWEGFGIPVLEAMACGTPVITSKLASLPEVAGDAAFYVDPYSTKSMAAALSAIAKDDCLAQDLAERGLHRSQQFSWEKTGRETAAILKRFL